MSPVWRAVRSPPSRDDCPGFSPDAQIVWQYLQARHKPPQMDNTQQRDSASYYSAIYQRQFGCAPLTSLAATMQIKQEPSTPSQQTIYQEDTTTACKSEKSGSIHLQRKVVSTISSLDQGGENIQGINNDHQSENLLAENKTTNDSSGGNRSEFQYRTNCQNDLYQQQPLQKTSHEIDPQYQRQISSAAFQTSRYNEAMNVCREKTINPNMKEQSWLETGVENPKSDEGINYEASRFDVQQQEHFGEGQQEFSFQGAEKFQNQYTMCQSSEVPKSRETVQSEFVELQGLEHGLFGVDDGEQQDYYAEQLSTQRDQTWLQYNQHQQQIPKYKQQHQQQQPHQQQQQQHQQQPHNKQLQYDQQQHIQYKQQQHQGQQQQHLRYQHNKIHQYQQQQLQQQQQQQQPQTHYTQYEQLQNPQYLQQQDDFSVRDEFDSSQPLYSQWSNAQHSNDTSQDIEIIGEDEYCSPPLDLSPHLESYAILTQQARRSDSKQIPKSSEPLQMLGNQTDHEDSSIANVKRKPEQTGTKCEQYDNAVLLDDTIHPYSGALSSSDNFTERMTSPEHVQDFENKYPDKPLETIDTSKTNLLSLSAFKMKSKTSQPHEDAFESSESCAQRNESTIPEHTEKGQDNKFADESLEPSDMCRKRNLSSLSAFKAKFQQEPQSKQQRSTTDTKTKTKPVFKKPQRGSTAHERSSDSSVPFDASIEEVNNTSKSECSIPNACMMTHHDLTLLETHLLTSRELAVTAVYSDGTSLLRQKSKKGPKKAGALDCEVSSVVIAYPEQSVLIPLIVQTHQNYSTIRNVIGNVMGHPAARKVCYDAQQVMHAMIKHFKFDHSEVSLHWSKALEDPKIAAWLLNSDDPPQSFQQVIHQHCKHLIQLFTSSSQHPDIGSDLSLLCPAMTCMSERLHATGLWPLYSRVEVPLVPVLAVMELSAVNINTKQMNQAQKLLEKKLGELEKAGQEAAGQAFSINSHPQLRVILFEKLKLHTKLGPKQRLANTSVGHHKSTCESSLVKLEPLHPLPGIVLQHRQVQKLKSTYYDGILSHVSPDGRLFTHWDQTSAATGRLTSTQPNIQSIPKQVTVINITQTSYVVGQSDVTNSTEIFAREPFIAKDGHSFLAADFQQMEFRLFAHLASDPVLLDIFNSPHSCGDVFIQLTAQWHSKSPDDVSKTEREQSKRVVYSVMYGVGKEKLSEYLKTTPDEAKRIMSSFLLSFPGVSTFSKRCVDEARSMGYQKSLFGRRRYLPHIKYNTGQLRAQAERQAVNFCVQGSAADVCKAATLQVQQTLAQRNKLKATLLFHIHDELLLEVADENLKEVAGIVKSVMENKERLCGDLACLTVPLPVSISVGKSWANLKDYSTAEADLQFAQ